MCSGSRGFFFLYILISVLTKWEQSCAVFRIHNWEPKNMLLPDGSTCECTGQAVGCRYFFFPPPRLHIQNRLFVFLLIYRFHQARLWHLGPNSYNPVFVMKGVAYFLKKTAWWTRNNSGRPTPRKGGKREEIQIHTSCQSFQNKISVHYIYNLAIYPGVKFLWSQIQRCDFIHSSIKRQI